LSGKGRAAMDQYLTQLDESEVLGAIAIAESDR